MSWQECLTVDDRQLQLNGDGVILASRGDLLFTGTVAKRRDSQLVVTGKRHDTGETGGFHLNDDLTLELIG